MKKAITLKLCFVIAISLLLTVLMSYYLQLKSAKEAMYENSLLQNKQIAEILERNDAEVEALKESLREDYIIRAKAAAYLIQNNPEVNGNLEEIRKIASLLQIDELHLFDTEGTLFSGTEPKYYGYTFNSGEQMRYFLPLLDDYTMELFQDVTPNTAESKQMQYGAVWREDRQGIIQIGMEPIRLLEAMKKNELSHLFTMLTVENGITAFATDPETGLILGATNAALVNSDLEQLGITQRGEQLLNGIISGEQQGKKSYYVLQKAGDVLIGVGSTYESVFNSIPSNMVFVVLSLCVISAIMILLIVKMLDRYIIHGMNGIITGMRRIADGDLDACVNVSDTKEFVELSGNINYMVKRILEITGKLSLVFQNVNIPIAVYEYSLDMKRVLATNKIGEILHLTDQDIHKVLSDRELFCEKIRELWENPFDKDRDIYLLDIGDIHYIKIKSYREGHKTLGVLVDVTDEIVEKKQIEFERDYDPLTGLFSRRAFFREMARIFMSRECAKTAMVMMLDLDNLKYVNDSWGHENGDRLLQKTAELLNGCKAPHKLVSRLSGDEFVLIIYGVDASDDLDIYLEQLCADIKEAAIEMCDGESVQVRLSGGYVIYPEVDAGYREILHLADQTMYQVKKNGKGYIEKYCNHKVT